MTPHKLGVPFFPPHKLMVDSFNYAFQTGTLSISPRLGIISLIPKKDNSLEFWKNWRPITLLNTDYKIPTKAIIMRLEKYYQRLFTLVKQCI